MKKKIVFSAGILGIIFLLTIYDAFFFEPNNPKVEEVLIRSPKIGQQFVGTSIVQISDLHLKRLAPLHYKVAKKVNDLGPDYIFITGDFFSLRDALGLDEPQELELELNDIIAFLKLLEPKKGLYLVRGNNDFTIYKERSNIFLERLEEEGFTCLSNKRVLLGAGRDSILLAGVDFSEFDQEDVVNFRVSAADHAFEAAFSDNNSYSHFFKGDNTSPWRNYTYSGRMKNSSADGYVGVTFYSHLDKGMDRFYRLRHSSVYPAFYLSPHGTTLSGDSLSTGVVAEPDIWYSFKIRVTTLAGGTKIQAKVWPLQEQEPSAWQAETVDRSDTRITDGTIGLWSAKQGERLFDDLLVVDAEGDTLLQEDFDHYPDGADPYGWLDFDRGLEAIPMLKAGVPDSLFSILLAHSPDYAVPAAASGFDLVLSGHTHGGQVRLPLLGAPLVHITLGQKFVQGLNQIGSTMVYTNRGLGTVWQPVRFLCRPEITLLHLVR